MSLDLPEIKPHIGVRLRLAREAIPMSHACIARELKIQTDYVAAIEALDRDSLPSIGYVLGYVRGFAGIVGLDPQEAVNDFKVDSEVPENLGMRNQPHFVPKRQIRMPRGFIAATTVLSCAAVLSFWYASKTDAQSAALTAISTITVADNAADVEIVAIDPERMMITATAPSWIEIKDKDGKTLISRIMIAGESWEAHQDIGVTVSARDSGAFKLYLGEDLMGSLGAKGVPMTDIPMPAIPPEFMSDFARELAGLPPKDAEAEKLLPAASLTQQ